MICEDLWRSVRIYANLWGPVGISKVVKQIDGSVGSVRILEHL